MKTLNNNLKTDKSQFTGVRVKIATKEKIEKLRQIANDKKLGNTVKVDELISAALDLLTDEQLKKLQLNCKSGVHQVLL